MRENHTPASRGRRGSHARRSSVSGRISASVARPPRRPQQPPEAEAARGWQAQGANGFTLRPMTWLGRRLAVPRAWEPGLLRRFPHPRTIRAKIVCLLMVPIVSLTTLWGLAAVQAAQNVYTLVQLKQLNAAIHAPTDQVVNALQRERTGVAGFLGGQSLGAQSTGRPDTGLTAEYAATDSVSGTLRTGAGTAAAAAAGLGVDIDARISTLLADLSGLPTLRGETARRQVTWATAQAGYTKAISDALALEGALATVQDSQVTSDAWPVLELARSREMLARQAAIVTYAQAGGGGGLDADGYRQFAGAYYTQYELEQAALSQLRAGDVAAYREVTSAAPYQRLRDAQLSVLNAGSQGSNAGGVQAAAEAAWASLAPATLSELGGVVAGAGTAAVSQVDPYGHALATKAGIGVVLGLIAVTASLLVSVWIGRGMVVELTGLRDAALDLARRRLPRAIARLRAGETVDLAAEAPVGPGGRDEVGQVAEALATVHQAALRAAVERAEAVSGVAGVFLNLARRSQVLLHRQLALLDLMERRVEDPADLEDLFRLDHLATRMRRHAEGLIILSGAAPGRGWRRPVPLMDVVRAAVAEVEDYARVDVRQMPDVHVAGAAVADLAHLVAELVENATAFSPPHTRVQVHGALVAAGYAVEIEDRGLGMGVEAMNEANRRIGGSRQADLFDGDRLGLSVVSRLARRHDIGVALRTSAYGGTTAVVLLPKAMLDGGQTPALPRPAGSRADQGADVSRRTARPPAERAAVLVGAASGAGSESGVGSGPAPGPAANAPRDPAAHADPAALRESAAPETPGGLPRRVRQASLAPGLRDESGPPNRGRDDDGDPATRSPEQARATMAAYQHGWSLGRSTPDSPDRPPNGAAPATTPPTTLD